MIIKSTNSLSFLFPLLIMLPQLDGRLIGVEEEGKRHKRATKYTNNYGYGLSGWGPQGASAGTDGFGFVRDKYYNSAGPPLYTWSSYRNYYEEAPVHANRKRFKTFLEEFIMFKNRHINAQPTKFEMMQQERYGPYYNGVWGNNNHSPDWFGK